MTSNNLLLRHYLIPQKAGPDLNPLSGVEATGPASHQARMDDTHPSDLTAGATSTPSKRARQTDTEDAHSEPPPPPTHPPKKVRYSQPSSLGSPPTLVRGPVDAEYLMSAEYKAKILQYLEDTAWQFP